MALPHPQIVPFAWVINRDPRHFERPGEFRPERFLVQKEGDGGEVFNRDSRIMFFGIGEMR